MMIRKLLFLPQPQRYYYCIKKRYSSTTTTTTTTTADGTRQFFIWLEQTFGGNLPMDTEAEILISEKQIQLSHLQRLLKHDNALAIHVKNYYPKSSAIKLAKQLATTKELSQAQNWKVSTSKGLQSSDVLTLGAIPYNMAVAKSKSNCTKDGSSGSDLHEYYEQVLEEFQKRRRRRNQSDGDEIAQMIWPLDQLRLELDQIWPYGAGLARDDKNLDRCKSGGLTRITKGPTRWKNGFIHVDEMAPLNSDMGYFSANIYLQLPSDDKEEPVLDIWPLDIRNRWDWYKNANTLSALSSQDAEGQLILRKALGKPYRLSGVEPGDLILLCVQRPHAAVGFQNTTSACRISLQSFIQYSGDKQRLLIEA